MDSLRTINKRKTAQTTKARADQVKNNAGGYVFAVSNLTRLKRFLVLGVDGGTYYQKSQALATECADVIFDMAKEDHKLLVDTIVGFSTNGRIPRENTAIFALAIASSTGTTEEKRYALSQLPKVCRIGTHLFIFAEYIEQFRGWGRGLRRAVANWYEEKDVDRLAYQAVKYKQREGWSHRDLLRLSHPATTDHKRAAVYDWVVSKGTMDTSTYDYPEVIKEQAAAFTEDADIPSIVRDSKHLSWEMLPSESLKDPKVWKALIDRGMPLTALTRNLARLTNLGVLNNRNKTTDKVVSQLTNPELVKKSRMHPFNALNALKTYSSGRGFRGGMTWSPVRKIVDALDEMFYLSFGNVEATGKRIMLALDVSGSMNAPLYDSYITAREGSVAMALATLKAEKNADVVGFTSGDGRWLSRNTPLTELNVSPRQRLDDAVVTISGLPFGATDCALPMVHALNNKFEYDAFVIYTDSETWHGGIHPYQALRKYRETMGIDAKLIVVGMTSSGFSIADPNDAGMLDVIGFDSSTPNIITEFIKGTF